MPSTRWRRVEALYHLALERPATARGAFLLDACPEDDALRREVADLVARSEASGGILDDGAPPGLGGTELEPGQSLGPYRIVAPIGEGGMGRVYTALDTRLGRTVAIKVSRAGFTDRFRREARAVAAINHPHICTLYDLGPNYLVMEFVDGEPLRGPMPLVNALGVAAAIAGALDAAHRKGVIHRDLKPANILLTESGPKLLDFGLAKLEPASDGGVPESVTFASTIQASIAGTTQYMSPEQLQGRPIDVRSDLFSFGAVFFELLTGHPAFEGDNFASLIAAILTSRPNVRAYLPNLPVEVERVLDRALAKDPEDRWQSARDLKAALELLAAPAPPVARPVPRQSSRVAWGLATILGCATLGLTWMEWGPPLSFGADVVAEAPAASAAQLQWFDRSGRRLGTLGAPADYSNPAMSPDGRRLAVSVRTPSNQRDILVFDLKTGAETRLTSDRADETNPVWSPDGTEILYCSDRPGRRDLFVRSLVSGDERLLLATDRNKNPMDWARDGSAIFYNADRTGGGHDIWRLPLKGADRTPQLFLEGADSRDWVAVSPDARSLMYRVGRSPHTRVLLRAVLSPAGEWPVGGDGVEEGHWRADGRQFFYLSGETMFAQNVEADGKQMRLSAPTALFRVKPNTFGRNAFVVSPDGNRFLVRTGA
jgi:hypothetical protein